MTAAQATVHPPSLKQDRPLAADAVGDAPRWELIELPQLNFQVLT